MMGNVAVFCLSYCTGFPAAIESEVGPFIIDVELVAQIEYESDLSDSSTRSNGTSELIKARTLEEDKESDPKSGLCGKNRISGIIWMPRIGSFRSLISASSSEMNYSRKEPFLLASCLWVVGAFFFFLFRKSP